MRRDTWLMLRMAAALVLGSAGGTFAQDLAWQSHSDPTYGYSYEIPAGMFEQVESEPGKLVFEEADGGPSRLMIHSGDVPSGMSLRDFEDRVKAADWIGDITYRAGEGSWFVLSGHYQTESGAAEPLIFYTKFMLSRDGTRYSAFEITYPLSRKSEFAPIVARIEKGLQRPS